MTKSSTPVCLFFLVFIFFTSLTGQEIQTFPAQISQARLLGKTAPLSKLMNQNNIWHPGSKKKYKAEHPGVVPNFEGNSQMPNPFRETALPQDGDPLRAIDMEKDLFPVLPDQNFEGMNESVSNVLPPDQVGDVSPFHYIQVGNATPGSFFQIYDKEGNAIGPPTSPNVFWQPFNVTGFGDPIILFDHDADRWLITEFGGFGTNVMLLALSETSDPLATGLPMKFSLPNFRIIQNLEYGTTVISLPPMNQQMKIFLFML